MSDTFNMARAGALLASLLAQSGPALWLRDPSGCITPVRPETAGAPDGLLPVFAVAADAVWREATGNSFGLDIQPDPVALLGYRIDGASAGSISAMMLCILEAIDRAAGPSGLVVNDLVRVAKEAMPVPASMLPLLLPAAARSQAQGG